MKTALVFGGTGFLGSFVVKELCENNFQVVVVGRSEEGVEKLKLCGFPGQVVFKKYNINSINVMFDFDFTKYDCIINLIGIGKETRGNIYNYIHSDFPTKLASMAKKIGIKFVHVSAFTPENVENKYVITKRTGEKYVMQNNKDAVILKPTLMLGTGGAFVSDFESMINYLPFIPIIGFGKTKIKPVFASDVAKFIVQSIQTDLAGGTYNLSGSEAISTKDLIHKIMGFMNKKRRLLPMPLFIFKLIFFIKQLLPNFLFRTKITYDIIKMAKYESIPIKNDLTKLITNPTKLDKGFAFIFAKYKLYD